MDRLANPFNAAATAISDAQTSSMISCGALKPSATASIMTLGQHSALTLSELARILGLRHSATVRLVDGLEDKGLERRGDGQDRREVTVSLTVDGQALYARLRQAQGETLMALLEDVTPADKARLEALLSHILAAFSPGKVA